MTMLDREIRWLTDEKYSGDSEATELAQDIKRLQNGEHIAYVIGFVDFLKCRIDLSERPLIPRPETEFIVQQVIEELKGRPDEIRCLDIFSGSGCIGVALLKYLPRVSVVFSDIEASCIRQIQKNIRLNALDEDKAKVIQSDVFQNITGKYDCIIANPPYGILSRIQRMYPEVLLQEPHTALLGGEDGMFYIKRTLLEAKRFLNPGGVLFIEFDSDQGDEVASLAKANGWRDVEEIRKDQYGKIRYARLA